MKDRAVLITGGGKRIGAATARAFDAAGWHVVIHYRRSEVEAKALARTLRSAEIVQCDLADEAASAAMVEELASRLPDWRCLVNNASIFLPDEVIALDSATYDKVTKINAKAPAMLSQTFLHQARSTVGRCVINVTDQKLANPNPDFFSYTMSKHALGGAIRPLAMGAAGPADRVYGLAPGAILPSHDQSEAEAEASHRMNLLGRRTEAAEIADAAVFLAEGHLANGETLFVDSGQHLLSQSRDVIYLARGQETDHG
ncbi:SDR family oxidoreductase [Qipengyuania atrilutea]|uniref:SDR family oxidoreductase n=1 Tax=Qipengyuania atrilutea TaxID=2744473 RepID=A0A850H2A9_9SPHN|nr:SDR family oxidoreductase [Actirhodobacter atriluteus]NVD44053.1 SDR family oxidoreductase [Actirhodobacter atriluteus]